MIQGKFLTVKEIAKLLQLNMMTIYEYIRTNQLLAVRFGRSYRVFEQDLEQFIKIHKTKKL